MESKILEKITEQVKENRTVALIIITKIHDSTPRSEGSMMAVFEDGSITGTIGGGNLELAAIDIAKDCIRKGENRTVCFDLTQEGDIGMQCGGKVDVLFKIFKPQYKLMIAGAGHIALTLHKFGKMLGFYVVVFDDREKYLSNERLPDADELILGSYDKKLKEYNIDSNSFIVIVTHGHKYDEEALRAVIDRGAAYVGMIGSTKKNNFIKNNLLSDGVDNNLLDSIYAPIGLDLGGEKPEEISLSIMAEILAVKNGGTLRHIKNIK